MRVPGEYWIRNLDRMRLREGMLEQLPVKPKMILFFDDILPTLDTAPKLHLAPLTFS